MSTLPLRADQAPTAAPVDGDLPADSRRRVFVENVLPFLSSLVLHLSLVALGILTYKAAVIITTASAPPPVLPDPTAAVNDRPDRIPQFAGLENDPTRPARQRDFPDIPDTATGLSNKAALIQTLTLAAKDSGEDPDNTIALGIKSSFGPNGKNLLGNGTEGGPGIAPFGIPGGGSIGVKFTTLPPDRGVQKVVFLCDSSGSMTTKFDALRTEIRKAIDGLRPSQEFDIVFFSEDGFVALDKQLLYALPENKRRAYEFLDSVPTRGSSDPRQGLRAAFATKPELIYMLTDGDFPDNAAVLNEVAKLKAKQGTMVNTIAFMDRGESYEKLLQDIAKATGGVFRFVSEADLSQQK
jgi:hypothetical protein